MVFAAPVLTNGIIPDVLGVVAVIIDPTRSCTRSSRLAVAQQSAENPHGAQRGESGGYLNELRHQKHTALNCRAASKKQPFPRLGRVGASEGGRRRGLRQVRDVAAARSIPDTPWFVVV
jgi:hypothetical protein